MKDKSTAFKKFSTEVAKINTVTLYLSAVKQTSELALDLNRMQLLTEGIDAKGKSLGKYSPYTKRLKAAKGQETAFITLYDEGGWQESLFMDTKQIPVFIDSSDWKNEKLKNRFGEDITGLTPENQEAYKAEVMLAYKEKVNDAVKVIADKTIYKL